MPMTTAKMPTSFMSRPPTMTIRTMIAPMKRAEELEPIITIRLTIPMGK